MPNARRDIHSYSNPEQVQVRDLDLDCEVIFDRKILKSVATLLVERREPAAESLILDTRDLKIEEVEQAPEDGMYKDASFRVGAADPILVASDDQTRAGFGESADSLLDKPAGLGAAVARSAADSGQEGSRFSSRNRSRFTREAGSRCRIRPGVRLTYTAKIRHAERAARSDVSPNDPDAPRSASIAFITGTRFPRT